MKVDQICHLHSWNAPTSTMRQNSGFTLLEVLLVVMLMALASAGVMMALPGSEDDDTLENYAYLFAAQVRFIQDKAVMSADEFGIKVDKQGYRFVKLQDNLWIPVEGRVVAEQQFESPFSLYIDVSALEPGEEDLGFEGLSFEESDGLLEEDFIEAGEAQGAKEPPQVFVMASGEMTPFSVAFVSDNSEQAWWVYGDTLGQLSVERDLR